MKHTCIAKKYCILFFMVLLGYSLTAFSQTEYLAKDGWIIGHNKDRFNNRPLYLPKHSTFVLTGDNPVLRFVSDSYLYGTLYFTYEYKGVKKMLHEFDDITSMYKGGIMKWLLKDKAFPDLDVQIEVLPSSHTFMGGVIRLVAQGRSKDDKFQIVYGEKKDYRQRLSWLFDVMGHPNILNWGINDKFIADGEMTLSSASVQYIKVEMADDKKLVVADREKECYKKVYKEMNSFLSRMKIDTPDEYLNAVAMASLKAVDGSWIAPVFLHGCMQWNNKYPGWRTIFGGTMYGWHDRVFDEAQYYIDSQIKDSNKQQAKADEQYLLTKQETGSVYYGKGRISRDQSFYNMQSQFFDQLIEEYRWNNSPEYVAILRPALELHLKWQEVCFDPDGDGLYESYINTWPTDSQWYNGGGSAEETSYAYKGHKAAYDMAIAVGDSATAIYHQSMMEKIKTGFQSLLWIRNKGYSGAYKEQGGYQRVHENPWLYSIFLPIDAGLTSELQNIESLYYTEWALQNDKVSNEGRMVWTSNWMPAVWSVRELWPGDNYHLAYAYMKSGLSEGGWDILKGTMLNLAFNHTVPGNLGGQQGGIDFGDCIHPFARTLVSGLFGYMPDYPNEKVSFEPAFPVEWDHASIELPDFKLDFKNNGGEITYKLELAKAAKLELEIPVRCSGVKQVLVNGKAAAYELRPMPGKTAVIVKTAKTAKADIVIRYDAIPIEAETTEMECNTKSSQNIEFDGKIQAIFDPQGIMDVYDIQRNKADIHFNDNAGYHTMVMNVNVGTVPQLKVVRVRLNDTDRMRYDSIMNMKGVTLNSFTWKPVDLSVHFNADVRSIYKQAYWSPRPNTVSVRIGTDGYSPWTFPHWNSKAPEISLEKVESMLENGMLNVPQGVPFKWNSFDNNIAFVSLWDNFPDCVEIPVNDSGKAICFLVCGSTNMMQCEIANAEIELIYEDGNRDVMELVPPVNYWNLCPIQPKPAAAGQISRAYYDSEIDRFSMPKEFPCVVSLGKNCNAMVLPRKLREGVKVEKILLRCLSQEVVVGLMGVSISK